VQGRKYVLLDRRQKEGGVSFAGNVRELRFKCLACEAAPCAEFNIL